MRLVPSVRRRIRLASRSTEARISRSRTRGSKEALVRENVLQMQKVFVGWLGARAILQYMHLE